MPARSRFLEDQHRFFENADVKHFFWQTQNPYFARTERELLAGFPYGSGQTILELGCGEGGNLVNLFATASAAARRVVGLDLSYPKLCFAKGQFVGGRFICGDAGHLPFPEATFDLILCRDLLHHLPDPEPTLKELRRVSKPGGTIWIIEPNGKNPLIRMFALVKPHERGQLRNSIESLSVLLARYFPRVEIDVRQPFPLYRAILHYQYGFPSLGFYRAFASMMDAWDRTFQGVLPRRWWAYIVAKVENAPS
jgi:ubiquinone/menaquinone biosynthesis C-methylase UbiE